MSVGLTKEQLEKFEKDGLLVLDNFLSPEEVTNIRKSERRNPSIFLHLQHCVNVHKSMRSLIC